MGGLQKFEQKLEAMISGAFARAFRSAVQPVEIAAALQRECDNNAQILSRQRRMAPNDFHVELVADRPRPAGAVRHRARRRAGQPGQGPRRAAELRLPRPGVDRLRVRRRPDHRSVPGPQPRPGEGHRQRQQHAGTPGPGAARGQRHPPPAAPAGRGRRPGHRGRPPDQRPGRQPPAHRVRGLPGRRGALRLSVRDLGSTNGMLVDGHRISHTGVRDGTTVKIGNTTMTVKVIEEDMDV